jgi:hypothetical protein
MSLVTAVCPICLRYILILSFYLHFGFSSCLFFSGFLSEILYAFVSYPMSGM